MKPLVAIVTCHKFKKRADAQRNTWLPSLKLDYKFFLGQGADREPGSDEIFLDVPDDYLNLPIKVQAIMRWAKDRGYTAVFKIDDDTYLFPDRLSIPQAFYSGRLNRSQPAVCPHGWCSGFAYWLTLRALDLICEAPIPDEKAEDLWVGKILGRHGIKCLNNPGFIALSVMPPQVWGHFYKKMIVGCEFAEEKMYEIHDLYTNPARKNELKSFGSLNPRHTRYFPIRRK